MRYVMVLAASITFVMVGVSGASVRPTQAVTPGRWVTTDLGTLGGPGSGASAINNRGQIVGAADTKNEDGHAVLWHQGKMRDLGTLPGFRHSAARDINERGQVVGESWNEWPNGRIIASHAFLWQKGKMIAFLWHNGKMTDLGTLGGTSSGVDDINDRGQIVGSADKKRIDDWSGLQVHHAYLWENGRMRDLGLTPTDWLSINDRGQVAGEDHDRGRAFLWEKGKTRTLTLGVFSADAINEAGQIVGSTSAVKSCNWHAYLWEKGKMRDLGTLPGNQRVSSAEALNDRGQVVGTSEKCVSYPDQNEFSASRAFLWQEGKMIDLGPLGYGFVWPKPDINERGQIVATSQRKPVEFHARARALVWQKGKLIALPTPPGTVSSEAVSINDNGQIIGTVTTGTSTHAVLWTFKH